MASIAKTLWPAAALALCFAGRSASAQAPSIRADQAARHIGERVTACGLVASTKYLSTSNKLTLLNFDRPYPNQTLSAVIYPEVREKFTVRPDSAFTNRRLCVTGAVTLYRDKPQLVVESPQDVAVQKDSTATDSARKSGSGK